LRQLDNIDGLVASLWRGVSFFLIYYLFLMNAQHFSGIFGYSLRWQRTIPDQVTYFEILRR